MGGRLAAATIAAWLGAIGSAHAADQWSDPLPGVRLLRRTTNVPWKIFALQIDLCHDGVSLRATKTNERQRTVSSFAALVGADAAINGDFFSYEDYGTSGLAMGAAERWSDTADTNGAGVVAFGRGRAEIRKPSQVIDPPEAWMREVISGHPGLVENGTPIDANSGELCTTRHPRTASGISADGRTLVLVVVDGRTEQSAGMTCTELAALLAELGADDAINNDGGGSSTMWLAGDGVLNAPSDGAQRVVGNHLGLVASGAGEPGSCDRSREESSLHGEATDASTTTDVDGDGRADLCARAAAGFRCHLANDTGFGEANLGPELSDELGWNAPSWFGTLRMGDLDGDGKADLCGRDAAGVQCWRSEGTAFATTPIVGPELSDELGWAAAKHWGTIRMADVDGDGRDDLCARAADGLMCWRSTGDGFAEPFTLAGLSDEAGFAAMSRFGTIRMADIDADARADVCARTDVGMRCWLSTGTGFGAAIEGPAWSDDAGFGRVEYWSTIRLVDIDADRRADLCVRAAAGLQCHLSTGDGFGEAIAGPVWSDESGWWDYSNYSTIRFADLDADGDLDVCARANAGMRCAAWDAGAFGESFEGPALADDADWGSLSRFGTLRFADLDADGRADLCARGAGGVSCWRSNGAGFDAAAIAGPAWSDDSGWSSSQYFETLHAVPPRQRCVIDERCDDGVDDDCDGEIDEGCEAGTSEGSTGDTGSGGERPGGSADDAGSGSDDGGGLPDTFGEQEDEGGCACASEPGAHGLAWLGVVLAVRRRRR